MEEIRLNSTDSVFSTNKENTVHIQIDNTTKRVPLTNLSTIVDQYEVYKAESSACNKYRLTLTMKPYCTNVLFNTCTEIIKNEGDEESKVCVATDSNTINISNCNTNDESRHINGLIGGIYRSYMVDNTEYSSENIGYDYHPGYDIFGNHLLRSLTFRSVIPLRSGGNQTYNTISDTMRSFDGKPIKTYPRFSPTDVSSIDQHIYDRTNLLSMRDGESVETNLIEQNGWYGFYNNSSIAQKLLPPKSSTGFTPPVKIGDSNHVINNKGNCEFVDMYPDRTLYSFTPKINPYKHRIEKNWDVFITYPYKNFYRHNLVTNVYAYDIDSEQITFDDAPGDEQTNALLIMEAKNQYCRNGMDGVQFRTFCKHNLKQNDYIVLYYAVGESTPNFKVCSSTFRVNYVGDMNNEHKDYYFTITNSSILTEIFDGMIETVFYDETTTPPAHFREISGDITEIPQELDTSDTTYEPNICRWFYEELLSEPIVSWDNSNTVDTLPVDVINGPTYVRQRQNRFVYYRYVINSYLMLPASFDPTTQTFGDGNTFDDVPVGYVTNYVRVHLYKYFHKTYKYYIQKTEKVRDIVNSLLCNYIPLRFAKVVNGVKCKYYIRMFKKLPNLNHSIEDLTNEVALNPVKYEKFIERNATKLNENRQIVMRDFDREVYPLAFSKTIYGDDITQYQFTDTMDIAYIRDNLGRPLTNLYVTIVKKNVGYKDWYGRVKHYSDYNENNIKHRVEYSHCFGKVTSGLDYLTIKGDDDNFHRKNKGFLSDAKLITNVVGVYNNPLGQPLEIWGGVHTFIKPNNELDTEGILEDDDVFFGDVVEYNPMQVIETTLSDVQFRFNTAQRENGNPNDYLFTYKEIVSDDYHVNGFDAIEYTKERSLICPEGYYYKAHYPVGVRSFGNTVKQASHFSVLVDHAEPVQMEGMFIRVVTRNNHGYAAGRKAFICNDTDGIWYNTQIVYVDSKTSFIINPIRKDVEVYEGKPYLDWVQVCNLLNSETLRIRVTNPDIPDYADNISVNLFLWREIIPASESDDEIISAYPFANGSLYIDKCINLFLKRQDPEAINGLYYHGAFPDVEGEIQIPSNYDYIPEIEITC